MREGKATANYEDLVDLMRDVRMKQITHGVGTISLSLVDICDSPITSDGDVT